MSEDDRDKLDWTPFRHVEPRLLNFVSAEAGILKDEPIRRMILHVEANSIADAIEIVQAIIDTRPTKLLTITSVNNE